MDVQRASAGTGRIPEHILAIAPAWAPEVACDIRQPLESKSRLRQLISCKYRCDLIQPSIRALAMEEFKIDLTQNEENAVCYEVHTEAAGTGNVESHFLCFV